MRVLVLRAVGAEDVDVAKGHVALGLRGVHIVCVSILALERHRPVVLRA